jgi:adenosylhomocysteine nucleosidase
VSRLGIIAALPREIAPLVRGWQSPCHDRVALWVHGDCVAACAGMGADCVTRAAEAAVNAGATTLVSVGYAGGLSGAARTASIWVPATVVDAATGERFATGIGRGTLVSVSMVAGADSKRSLAEKFGGDVIDMEAAAVARHAERRGLRFYAVKAVSDTRDARLPDLNRFTRNGMFLSGRFAIYTAIRPWMWPAVARLGRDSVRAVRALNAELENWIEAAGPPARHREGAVQHQQRR